MVMYCGRSMQRAVMVSGAGGSRARFEGITQGRKALRSRKEGQHAALEQGHHRPGGPPFHLQLLSSTAMRRSIILAFVEYSSIFARTIRFDRRLHPQKQGVRVRLPNENGETPTHGPINSTDRA